VQVQAYLNFDGRCEEALEFYRKALGAEVSVLMKFKDSPEPCGDGQMPPGTENKVMHSTFRIGESTLMASDCHCKGQAKFEGISLTLGPKTVAAAEKAFAALSDGGAVQMPLTKTFWSPSFGVVTDKFGVPWMVSATA
jgi:PhnB protein